MRAALESLLRDRKLDVTLTSSAPLTNVPADRLAPTGDADLDGALGGGLRRGHLSEVVGAASSGRTTLVMSALAAATARGEVAAIVDVCDTFDPASAAARGVELTRVLWVRESSDPLRALKAFSLVLQAGNFGLVVFDLADVAPPVVRRFPFTTWLRVARAIEGSDTVALIVAAERTARSPLGATLTLDASPARWMGAGASRARLFAGVRPAPRIVRARAAIVDALMHTPGRETREAPLDGAPGS
jgi:recombination protein RecA